MHRSFRFVLVVLVIGVSSWLGYRWLSQAPEVVPLVTVVGVPRPAPPMPVAAPTPAPSVATAQPASAPAIDPTLAKTFSTSTNYREFIRRAKADIEHGGGAYASAAQRECMYVRTVLDALKTAPPLPPLGSKDIVAKAEARTLLEARCGPLSEHETYPLVSQQLKKSGTDDLDPLLRIQKLVSDPAFKSDPDARRRFIRLAIETHDPMLWTFHSSLIVDHDDTWKTAYFDGVTYSGNDAKALNAAVSLTPCGLGFECARGDTIVAVTCLQHHVCEHDRFALVKLQADYQQYDFLQVMKFHDALVAAVNANNVDAFVKP